MPLKKFLKKVKQSKAQEHEAQVLTVAVLLFRLVRSDGQAKMLELMHMSELLRKEFSLSQQELEEVFSLANSEEAQGIETGKIVEQACEGLDQQKRIKILEYLWIMAFADDQIDKHEVTLIKDTAKQLKLNELEQAIAQENAETHLGLNLF